MRSIFFLLSAYGAVSHASECQADETSMLQGRSLVRRHKQNKATESQALLKKLQGVANSLVEGSDTTMSRDEIDDALNAASEALAELAPAIREQIGNAQRQLNHAGEAVQVCHAQEQAELRASLQASALQYSAAVESCEAAHQITIQEEQDACDRAQDCLCDEARIRTIDQTALCAAMTETYEVAYCEHHHVCTIFHQCHTNEAVVFNELRADVEAEMAVIVQEYIVAEQASCLTGLIMESMLSRTTLITHAAIVACSDVDVSVLNVNFPELPAEPAACPASTVGAPECALWQLIAHQEVANWFPASARDTFNFHEGDASASSFMNVGTITPSAYSIDGKYHLRLVYGGVTEQHRAGNDGPALNGGSQEFEWTQTSWITETSVSGYEPVSPADLAASPTAGCVFWGLAKSSTAATVFDGSPSHGNWFHSVGSTQQWGAGIPAFKGGAAQSMSLYIRRAVSAVQGYTQLAYGAANCAEGKRIETYEECEAAHVALGFEVNPVWQGTHGGIPGSCSTREQDWGGGHHMHWNNQAVGVVRADLSPVCRL